MSNLIKKDKVSFYMIFILIFDAEFQCKVKEFESNHYIIWRPCSDFKILL